MYTLMEAQQILEIRDVGCTVYDWSSSVLELAQQVVWLIIFSLIII
jgi:hypothetical protein